MRRISKQFSFISLFLLLAELSFGQSTSDLKRIDSISRAVDSVFKIPVSFFSDTLPVYICFTNNPPRDRFVISSVRIYGDRDCTAWGKYFSEIKSFDWPDWEKPESNSQSTMYYHGDQLIKVYIKSFDSLHHTQKVFYFFNNKLVKAFSSNKNEILDLKKLELDYLKQGQEGLERLKKELEKTGSNTGINFW